MVKVILPQAFRAWAGAAHLSDKKADIWYFFFNHGANKCGRRNEDLEEKQEEERERKKENEDEPPEVED